eukprot:311515_1
MSKSSGTIINNTQFNNNNANDDGGAFYMSKSSGTIINNTQFNNNNAINQGGGCFTYNTENTITNDVQFINNNAKYGGGWYSGYNANTILKNSQFNNNRASRSGGGLFTTVDNIIINNTQFNNNSANYWGGGLYTIVENILVSDSKFTNNNADFGGAVYTLTLRLALTIIQALFRFNHCKLKANHANYEGGGLYINNVNVEFSNSIMVNNSAESRGGGLIIYGNSNNIHLFYSIINENSANFGGGIGLIGTRDNESTLQVFAYDSYINNNIAETNGGGIFINGGNFTTFACEISSNKAHFGGGLFHQQGWYIDFYSTFINNTGFRGGGIYIDSDDIVLNQTHIIQNMAKFGGGIYSSQDFVDIENSLLIFLNDNSAEFGGGAIYNDVFVTANYSLIICNNDTIHCDQDNNAFYGSNISSKAKSISVALQNYTHHVSNSQISHLYAIRIMIYDDYGNKIRKTMDKIFVEWNYTNNTEYVILETHTEQFFSGGSLDIFLELKLSNHLIYNNVNIESVITFGVFIQGNRLVGSITIPCNNVVYKIHNPEFKYIIRTSVILSIISTICVVIIVFYVMYQMCSNNNNNFWKTSATFECFTIFGALLLSILITVITVSSPVSSYHINCLVLLWLLHFSFLFVTFPLISKMWMINKNIKQNSFIPITSAGIRFIM